MPARNNNSDQSSLHNKNISDLHNRNIINLHNKNLTLCLQWRSLLYKLAEKINTENKIIKNVIERCWVHEIKYRFNKKQIILSWLYSTVPLSSSVLCVESSHAKRGPLVDVLVAVLEGGGMSLIVGSWSSEKLIDKANRRTKVQEQWIIVRVNIKYNYMESLYEVVIYTVHKVRWILGDMTLPGVWQALKSVVRWSLGKFRRLNPIRLSNELNL